MQLLLSRREKDLATFPTHQHSEALQRGTRHIPQLTYPGRPSMWTGEGGRKRGSAYLLVLGEREVMGDQRVSVQSGREREERPTSVMQHILRGSVAMTWLLAQDSVSIATHRFWDIILSISSQVWKILRPWTVFSVRDLKMTSSSGRST